MPANQQIVIPAPTGLNISDESLETSANTAQRIANLLCDRLGKIRSDISQVNACDLSFAASAANVEPSSGNLYYVGLQSVVGTDIYGNEQITVIPNVGADYLLILIDQILYVAQYVLNGYVPGLTSVVQYIPQYPYKFQSPIAIDFYSDQVVFTSPPSRIRGAQFGNEMVIVQDNSLTTNYRFYSTSLIETGPGPFDPFNTNTSLYVLGLPTPPDLVLGTDIVYHSPSAGHVARTGTPSYSIVYLDEFGRQSSPSVPVQLDFTSTNAGKDALISFAVVNPSTLQTIYGVEIYEYVTGNANAYLIYTSPVLNVGSNTITYEDGPTGTTDTTIEQGSVGPTPGENDPPNPASIAFQYLDRMCLNDNTNPDTLQISNAGSPTQFNLLGYNPNSPNPADGMRAPVNSDNGDPITGGVSFGTFAVILKTRGLYYLYGQNSSNFQIQQVGGAVGNIAKDSVQVLNNGTILYVYSDGVYSFDGSNSNKISHQLDKAFLGYDPITLSQAQSKYVNRRYWLSIGTDNWIFDQDANQGQGDWGYFVAGVTAQEFAQEQYGLKPGQYYAGVVPPQKSLPAVPQPSQGPQPMVWSPYDRVILATPGLERYWYMGQSTSVVTELLSRQNGTAGTGVTTGIATLLPGATCDVNPVTKVKETACSFNNTSTSQITIPSYAVPLYPITLEAWVKITAMGTYATIVGQTSNDAGLAMVIGTIDAIPDSFGAYGPGNTFHALAGTIVSPVVISTNTVYYLVVTSDGTLNGTKYYINGVLQISSGSGTPLVPNLAQTQIGWRTDDAAHSFDGIIQKVAVYNVALSATEINNHWMAAQI